MPLDDLRWWPCSVLRDVMEAADIDMAFEARLGLENTVREDSDDGRGEYEANDWSVAADVAGSLRIEAGAPGGVYGADVSTCRCRCAFEPSATDGTRLWCEREFCLLGGAE